MKKILVLGPISDFGGREIEVNYILETYKELFDVTLFSTITMNENSVAIPQKKIKWSTLEKRLCAENPIIKFNGFLAKFVHRANGPIENSIFNNLNKRLFNFEKIFSNIIEKEIMMHDVVLFSGEITSKWLDKVILYSVKHNKKSILRTTGTIKNIPELILPILPSLNCVLIHSKSNYEAIYPFCSSNLRIIDQTTLLEKQLLKINSRNKKSNKLVFGYLGRFGREKGILELLSIFEKNKRKLLVAGNGYLLNEVVESTKKNYNIEYLGELSNIEIVNFFNLIDVLIIPSYEESGPLVSIEAMAAGKIIISTKVGAMEDRLSLMEKQFWFQIENEESLNYNITLLEHLSSNEINQLMGQFRNAYKSNYSNEIIGESYIDLIDKL